MNRTEYLETRAGQEWSWRNRQRRQLRLFLNVGLESKNSSTLKSNIEFQRLVKAQLLKQGRQRAYRAPVALQLDFTPSRVANFPSIHSLAKHYLDLFQKPVKGSDIPGSRLLLQDDRLVKLLICNCHLHGGRQGMRVRAATLNDFGADLMLYKRILDNNFSDPVSNRGRWIKPQPWRDVDMEFDSLWELKQEREDYENKLGEETSERLNLLKRRSLQEALLLRRQIHPEQLITLFGPDELRGSPYKRIFDHLRAAMRDLQMRALTSVSLGALPSRSGDSERFTAELDQTLDDFRAANPYMFPLLTTIGVTVVHTPGTLSQGIDLDNLARKIIPAIHEKLSPPATGFHGLTPLERVKGDPHFDEIWASLKRVPKYHVSRYQMLEIPRTDSDPEEGSLKLILHSGSDEGLGPWHEMDQTIHEWQSSR
jgi:hypothetical protein